MTDVEQVARAMIVPLGYPAGVEWERVFVGNMIDAFEGSGSLKHLCMELASAAIAAMQPQPVAGLVEAKALVVAAYCQGAQDVHDNWQDDRDPDFTEAGLDYAASVSPILAALSPPAEPSEAMIDFGVTAYFHATGDPRDGVAAIYSAMTAARNET